MGRRWKSGTSLVDEQWYIREEKEFDNANFAGIGQVQSRYLERGVLIMLTIMNDENLIF